VDDGEPIEVELGSKVYRRAISLDGGATAPSEEAAPDAFYRAEEWRADCLPDERILRILGA
jgi:hypothetical protein